MHPIPDVSGPAMLRCLIENRGLTQFDHVEGVSRVELAGCSRAVPGDGAEEEAFLLSDDACGGDRVHRNRHVEPRSASCLPIAQRPVRSFGG